MTDPRAETRRAIADLHDAIERLPLAAAMASGTIARADYVRLLSQLRHVHEAVEEGFERFAGDLGPLWAPSRVRRLPAIDRDLAALGASGPVEALPETAKLASEARRAASASNGEFEAGLAASRFSGFLYVLEGSRLGSAVLVPSLARALGVEPAPGRGLDYHLEGSEDRGRSWREFIRTYNHFNESPPRSAAAAGAAAALMRGLLAIYAAVPAPVPSSATA